MTYLVNRLAWMEVVVQNSNEFRTTMASKDTARMKAVALREIEKLHASEPESCIPFREVVPISSDEEWMLNLMMGRQGPESSIQNLLVVFGIELQQQIKNIKKYLPQSNFDPLESLLYALFYCALQSYDLNEKDVYFPNRFTFTHQRIREKMQEIPGKFSQILAIEKVMRISKAALQPPSAEVALYTEQQEVQAEKAIEKFQKMMGFF